MLRFGGFFRSQRAVLFDCLLILAVAWFTLFASRFVRAADPSPLAIQTACVGNSCKTAGLSTAVASGGGSSRVGLFARLAEHRAAKKSAGGIFPNRPKLRGGWLRGGSCGG